MTPSSRTRKIPVTGKKRQALLVRSRLAPHVRNNGDESNPNDGTESLRALPELARQIVKADYGAVTVHDPHGRMTEMVYAGLTEDEAVKIGAAPKGIGLLGRLGDGGEPLRLGRMSEHPHSVGFPPNHPEMAALLGVRVTSGKGSSANLYVARPPGAESFTVEDQEKIQALASYAALALDNARLYEDEHGLRAAAEASEQRLTAVIRGSAAGVIVKDGKTGHLREISGEAFRIFGIPVPDQNIVDGRPFESLYHHPDGTPMSREEIPMNIAMEKDVSVGPIDVLLIRPDGSRIPVLVSAAPVLNSFGELDSAICVLVDVTKLKEVEQAKDDFLSMITHDLRTPLTTIKGLAAAALDAAMVSDTKRAISFLEPIDEEVDYLAELVSNLLDMTRIEAGADVIELEECHLADITQDSLSRINRTRDAEGRYIHFNVPPDLPVIYADPRQIGRVVDNLLSNALKYSNDGIGITARVDPGEGHLRIEVRDQGPGIPPEHQEAVFDRFSRLKGSGSRGRQGSGLGLAICKSIIKAHSGEIGVQSTGNGSNFWFTLPVDTGETTDSQARTER